MVFLVMLAGSAMAEPDGGNGGGLSLGTGVVQPGVLPEPIKRP